MDCEEIRQAIYAYARGVDRIDEELIAASYHPGAFDDHGSWRGDRETAVNLLVTRSRSNTSCTALTHHIGNILIDLKGDAADVESYFIAYMRVEDGGKTFTRIRAGRYFDRFERRNGRWKVMRRQLIDDWSRLDEVVAAAPGIGPDNTFGARNETDFSYKIPDFVSSRKV